MTSQDDKREPKVYWADFNRHSDSEDDFFDFLAGDLLHKHPGQGPLVWQSSLVPMIEKKHYDALLAENQKLKSENSVLREALDKYADRNNWRYCSNQDVGAHDAWLDFKPDHFCKTYDQLGGHIARQALKKVVE